MSKRPRRMVQPVRPLEPQELKPAVKVAICVPCHDDVKAMFACDLANMVGLTGVGAVAAGKLDLELMFLQSTLVQAGRQDLAYDAIQRGATHVLFLDSDMRFPADTLLRLLNHGKAIVAANCVTRRAEPVPTAYGEIDEKGQKHKKIYSLPGSTGLEKVAAVGTAVMLIDVEVFKRLPTPWFNCLWSTEAGTFGGEDVFFCQLAGKAGIDVWVDHDLSKEVAHIGAWEYRHEHANAIRVLTEHTPPAQKIITGE